MNSLVTPKLIDYEKKENIGLLKKCGIILDLSDLHFTAAINEENEAYLLISDLKRVYFNNPDDIINLKDIDYLVVTGDFVEYGNETIPFDKAFKFINILSSQLNIPYERIVIVPGNHDLSWTVTMSAYHLTSGGTPQAADKVVTNVGTDIYYLKRDEAQWNKKFVNYSNLLYEKLYGVPFPDNPKEQIKVITGNFIENTDIAFFMLNTAAMDDQFNREITYFDTEGLVRNLRTLPEGNFFKIAVGHHPVELANSYGDDIPFANALQNSDFKIYLHGHVHRNISLNYLNPQDIHPNLLEIGAGALSVQQKGMWPGVPERYNIIKICKIDDANKYKVIVNTRQREYIGVFWQPAYIYYSHDEKRLTNIWHNVI